MKFSRISIIYNPKSTGNSADMARALRRELRQAVPNTDVQLIATKYAGHAKVLARDIAGSEKAPLIISSSGDGGYNEVVNGVMSAGKTNAVCAVLPAGNANDHSRTMQDRPLSVAIKTGTVRHIDLLKISFKQDNKTITAYAHSYAGLGLTPVVAVELNRHTLNSVVEMMIVLKTFFRYRPFRIMHDGRRIRLDSLLFGNINQMSKVLTIAPRNRPADGAFEVILFRSGHKFKLIRQLLKAALTSLSDHRTLRRYQFTTVKKIPMQLDGEVISLPANTTVTVESAHKALATIL